MLWIIFENWNNLFLLLVILVFLFFLYLQDLFTLQKTPLKKIRDRIYKTKETKIFSLNIGLEKAKIVPPISLYTFT